MFEITKNIYVSSIDGCVRGSSGLTVVHACKHPCYVDSSSILPAFTYLNLYNSDQYDLYMNIVDSSLPNFNLELIMRFLEFGTEVIVNGRELLIHCNEGKSRAPALAMLLMARLGLISPESYGSAFCEFIVMCPFYRPGSGIRLFLSRNWSKLINEK